MKTRILLIVLFGSLLFSCRNEYFGIGCINGNEEIITELRELDKFNGISLEGSFDIYITQENKSEVTIETDENLMDYIKTRVSGEILYLETKNFQCIRPSDNIKVYVSTPDIEKINLSGSGDIVCDSISSEVLHVIISGSGDVELKIDVDEFEADISGSGEMNIEGVADETDFRISGSGEIYALNLEQQICYASIPGSGDIRVSVERILDARISGSGSIYYLGDPEVSVSISGSGKVIKL